MISLEQIPSQKLKQIQSQEPELLCTLKPIESKFEVVEVICKTDDDGIIRECKFYHNGKHLKNIQMHKYANFWEAYRLLTFLAAMLLNKPEFVFVTFYMDFLNESKFYGNMEFTKHNLLIKHEYTFIKNGRHVDLPPSLIEIQPKDSSTKAQAILGIGSMLTGFQLYFNEK